MKRYLAAGYVLLPLMLLTACEVGPDYVRPSFDTPKAYKEFGDWLQAAPKDDIDRGAWWSVYNDPVLNDLEKQIDVSNQNLKAAEAAYRQAVAIADQTRASLFPTITTSPSAIRSGTGEAHVSPKTTYDLSASGSWNADVWGSIRRDLESGEASAEASAASIASARLSAEAELATDYFDLRIQDELERLLQAAVDDDARALKIVQNRYKAGYAAKADVLSAQTELESVQASAINVGVKRAQLEHAIAVLTGQSPAAFSIAVDHQLGLLPPIPVDVPSTLLERRPDIANAERNVAAANAQIGVAMAAWYPDLTLSASYGTTALALSKILQASSTVWSFGPTLAETLFDGGARDATVEKAKAAYDQQVAVYRQTVLTAFQQVEDNLAALRILEEQDKIEHAVVTDAHQATELTLNQYKEGIVSYSSVLTAQITELNNKQTALTVWNNRLDASVALIQALGGGWSTADLPH